MCVVIARDLVLCAPQGLLMRRCTLFGQAGDGLEFGMTVGQMTQVAYSAILEHFVQTGRAPHYTELADAIDVDIAEARELQRAAASAAPAETCWLAHDTDHIESWAPFSNVPTHYLISVDGIQKWYGQ